MNVVSSNSAAGNWIKTTATTVAPSNAAKVTIALQVGPYTGVSGTAGGPAYFDDVQFGPTALTAAAVSAASVSNGGTISIGLGGVVSENGNFAQTSAGILDVLLGGPPAAGMYGAVARRVGDTWRHPRGRSGEQLFPIAQR